MRRSNNYNLNLYEGSDVVNPLVQDVPNYEIIDEQMKKNADNGVPLATELLTGTVHALTRENPDASMFRFIATSNYVSGDTFTVDGVQVTALLTTGEPLATGSYVINSNVLCCLVGTVLTVFCSNNLNNIHAVDSEKLNGFDANYYAKATSVVEAINLAQNASDISLNNTEKLTALEEKVKVVMDVFTSYTLGSVAEITKVPYKTLALLFPRYANVNSLIYNQTYIVIDANAETFTLGAIIKNDGTTVNTGKIDFSLIRLPF